MWDKEAVTNLLKVVSKETGVDVESLIPPAAEVRPRIIVLKQRLNELKIAMIDRAKNEIEIPIEWVNEYDELLKMVDRG